MATAAGGEEWKRSGIIKVAGIPAPSGPYEVGTVELMSEGTLVRLYYPTNRQGAENYQYSNCRFRDIYIKRSLEILGVKLPWLFSGIINYFTYPKSPARQNAPLISPPETEDSTVPVKFPVIVFSHGLAGNFCLYNAINCDFASHGYVVASLEHKDGSSPVALRRVQPPGVPEGDYNRYVDEWIPYNNAIPMMDPKIFLSSLFTLRNSQVQQRAKEVDEVLDIFQRLNEDGVQDMLGGTYDFSQFRGRLDVGTAGLIGHSFGGGTVVQRVCQETRFKCGIALDSWLFPVSDELLTNGVTRPLMFVNADIDFQWPEKRIARMMKMITPPDEKGIRTCSMYTISGSTHMTQCDYPFVVIPAMSMSKEFTDPPVDKYVTHSVNMELCHAFFKRHLLQETDYQEKVAILEGGEGAIEHVIFGTNIEWEKTPASEEVTDEVVTEGTTTTVDEVATEGTTTTVDDLVTEGTTTTVDEVVTEETTNTVDEVTEGTTTTVDEVVTEGTTTTVDEVVTEGTTTTVDEVVTEETTNTVDEVVTEGTTTTVDEVATEGTTTTVDDLVTEGTTTTVDEVVTEETTNTVDEVTEGTTTTVDEVVTEGTTTTVDEVVTEGTTTTVDEVVTEETTNTVDEVVTEGTTTTVDEVVTEETTNTVDEVTEGTTTTVDEVVTEGTTTTVDEMVTEGTVNTET